MCSALRFNGPVLLSFAGSAGRGLAHQLDKGFHLRGQPFVTVVKQLTVHLHGAVRHIQPGKTTCGQRRTHDVLRQEGKTHALLHHLAQQRSAAQLQIRVDGKAAGGKALIQSVAVAHAALSEQKFLPGQLFQRNGFLPGKRVSGRCNKTHRLRHIRRKHQIGVMNIIVLVFMLEA